jgi:hypothetical protein
MANKTNTVRVYGNERTLGDIIYNPTTKSVFMSIELGFFGRTTLTLVKREDGAYDLMKPYVDKNGTDQVVMIGKTFVAKKKDGTIIDGLTKGTLALLKKYNKEQNKMLNDNSDALFITTHKLKENKPMGESGLIKVGFVTGVFGIEVSASEQNNTQEQNQNEYIETDDIPF